jgi:type IV secretion system protein VirB6
VPLRLTTTLFLAAAVYCALMGLCLKIAGTMVAGWQLPFSSGRDRKAGAAAAAAAQNGSQVTVPVAGEPASATSASSDPRMRSIISAASGGASPAFDRAPSPAHPLYAPAGQSPEIAGASAAPSPRLDPRLGSLSRHYRPRNIQFQRTHS